MVETATADGNGDRPSTDAEAVREAEPIKTLFNRPATVDILTELTRLGGQSVSVAELSEKAGVQRQTVYDNLPLLEEMQLVEEAGKHGNATVYRARMGSDTTDAFIRLRDTLIRATD